VNDKNRSSWSTVSAVVLLLAAIACAPKPEEAQTAHGPSSSTELGEPKARVAYRDDSVEVTLYREKRCKTASSAWAPCGEEPMKKEWTQLEATPGTHRGAVCKNEGNPRTDERGVARFGEKECSGVPEDGIVYPVIGYKDGTIQVASDPIELLKIEPYRSNAAGKQAAVGQRQRAKSISVEEARQIVRARATAKEKECASVVDAKSAKPGCKGEPELGQHNPADDAFWNTIVDRFCSGFGVHDGEVCFYVAVYLSAVDRRGLRAAADTFRESCEAGFTAACQRPEVVRENESRARERAATAKLEASLPPRASPECRTCFGECWSGKHGIYDACIQVSHGTASQCSERCQDFCRRRVCQGSQPDAQASSGGTSSGNAPASDAKNRPNEGDRGQARDQCRRACREPETKCYNECTLRASKLRGTEGNCRKEDPAYQSCLGSIERCEAACAR